MGRGCGRTGHVRGRSDGRRRRRTAGTAERADPAAPAVQRRAACPLRPDHPAPRSRGSRRRPDQDRLRAAPGEGAPTQPARHDRGRRGWARVLHDGPAATTTSTCLPRCSTTTSCSSSTTGELAARPRSTAPSCSRMRATTSRTSAGAAASSAPSPTCGARRSRSMTWRPSSTGSASTRSISTATPTGASSPRRSPSAIPIGCARRCSTRPTRWRTRTRGTPTSTGRW